MVEHRFRTIPPAAQLPPLHVQIFIVLRIWLTHCSARFKAIPELGACLQRFMAVLQATGGGYRQFADELGTLIHRNAAEVQEVYRTDYNTAPHQQLYEVFVVDECLCCLNLRL